MAGLLCVGPFSASSKIICEFQPRSPLSCCTEQLRLSFAFVALVALGTSAIAAQILPAPPDIDPAVSPSLAISSEILNESATPGRTGYEKLVVLSLIPSQAIATDSKAQVPGVAIPVLASTAVAFLLIILCYRHAVLHSKHSLRRRRRNPRPMAYI